MGNPRYIYLIGLEDVESSSVYYACRTKKTARKCFNEMKQKAMEFFTLSKRAERNKREFPEYYDILTKVTFESIEVAEMYTVHQMPFWRKIKLYD